MWSRLPTKAGIPSKTADGESRAGRQGAEMDVCIPGL